MSSIDKKLEVAHRAARIAGGCPKSFYQHVKAITGYLLGGMALGAVVGIALGGELTFFHDLFVLLASASVIILVYRHLMTKKYLLTFFFVFGFIPIFLLTTALSIYLSDDRYANYVNLVDDCAEIRWRMTCRWVNPLSRILAGVRCGDVSFLWIQKQELKKGYVDLEQQCYGG